MSDWIVHQQFHADNIYYANMPKLKRAVNASWHSIFSNSIIDGIFIIYFINIYIMFLKFYSFLEVAKLLYDLSLTVLVYVLDCQGVVLACDPFLKYLHRQPPSLFHIPKIYPC